MAMKTDSISLGMSLSFLKDMLRQTMELLVVGHHVGQMCKRVKK